MRSIPSRASLILAIAIGIAVGAFLVPRAWFLTPRESGSEVFCEYWLELDQDGRAFVLHSKLREYYWGFHDPTGVKECVQDYAMTRAEAVSSACRRRNDFDAGITIGTIFAAGRSECRSAATE